MNNTKEYSEEDMIRFADWFAKRVEGWMGGLVYWKITEEEYEYKTRDEMLKEWHSMHIPTASILSNHSDILRISQQEAEFRYGDSEHDPPGFKNVLACKRAAFIAGVIYLASQKPGTITPKNISPEY